jgi:hypothetical protein
VDTVPFGCYRRELFARLGGFDEDLIRNQDDEFNARLIQQGGKVMLLPDLTARYYARPTLRQLARMYFQYGLFKPLVARKVGRVMTIRQLVPAGFVAALAVTLAAALLFPGTAWLLGTLAILYGAAVIGSSAPYARDEGVACALALLIVFPTLHISYGVGFWRGLWRAVFHRAAQCAPSVRLLASCITRSPTTPPTPASSGPAPVRTRCPGPCSTTTWRRSPRGRARRRTCATSTLRGRVGTCC